MIVPVLWHNLSVCLLWLVMHQDSLWVRTSDHFMLTDDQTENGGKCGCRFHDEDAVCLSRGLVMMTVTGCQADHESGCMAATTTEYGWTVSHISACCA